MNKQLKFIFRLLPLLWLNISFVTAQTSFSDEAELKKQANKLFEDDEFEQAYPLYTQLLAVYPKDPDYNYRFGVCTLFATDDKEKAIDFLAFAENKDVEKEVMYYLAKAYHLNYRFDDAIAEYQKYKKAASAIKANKLQVDRQIEMCKNGKQLLHSLTDLVVIDKKEMSREEFYRAYDITQIGGKLLVKPDDKSFKTAVDKKKKDKSIIYLAKNNNQIFFASYGEDGAKGKDIYTTNRLDNGEFSKPVSLGAPINTDYDEDFPFLHPNGKDLFFCSKGHNSMGGYDIFKSTYNDQTKTWSAPVNLDFPINTPDDDILYVTDQDEKQAYFSSARASVTGKTEVYHINTERKPIDAAVISGVVVKNREDEKLNLKITVKNLADNTIVGIYNSIPTDGTYGMNLPNGGKFLFTVESPEFPIQSEVVVIPIQGEFKPIKQEISYELKTDKLVVKTIFDENGGDSNYLMALKFIKEKSKMNVNLNEVAVVTKQETNEPAEPLVKSERPKPGTKLSNEDIIKIANDDAKVVESEAKDAKEQADIAMMYANQKNEQAQNKSKEAADLFDAARGSGDNVKKQSLTEKANQTKQEADQLNEETVNAFNLAKKLELSAQAKQKEADLSKEYAADLEAAIKSKNPAQAMAKLDEQEKKLEELSKENEGVPAITNSLKLDVDNKKKELDKAIQDRNDAKQEIADNETIIASTKADAESTKSADLKKGLMTQIEELLSENKTKKAELEQKEARVVQLQKEYNGVKNQNEMINSVVEKAKTGSSEVAAAGVAAIDKAKLEEQVNEIKKSVEATNANVAIENTTENKSVASSAETKKKEVAAAQTSDNKETDIASNKKETAVIAAKQPESNSQKVTNENKQIASNNNPEIKNAETDINKAENSEPKVSLETLNKKYGEDISATAKITNEAERELAKAEALKNWNKAIDEHIEKQKEDLKTTNNTEEKRVLIKQISDAEQLSKDILAQTKESLAKAAEIKKQEDLKTTAAAASNENKQNAASNEEQKIDTEKLIKEDYTVINKVYSDKITATGKIENEVERENAKAELLKSWDKTINDKIANQKEELKSVTSIEKKKSLEKNISSAEELSREVKSQTTESVARVEKLKKGDNSVAGNVTSEKLNNNQNKTVSSKDTNAVNQNKNESAAVKNDSKTATENSNVNATESKENNNTVANTTKETVANTKENVNNNNETQNANKEIAAKNNEQRSNTNEAENVKKEEVANTKAEQKKDNETVANSSELKTDINNPVAKNLESKTDIKKPTVNTAKIAEGTIESINKNYTDEIAATSKITNEVEREQAKAEVLKNWNASIDIKIAAEKKQLATIKNAEQKKTLENKIKNAELKSKEVKAQTAESIAKAETLKQQQNNVAANTNSTNSNSTDINAVNKESKTNAIDSEKKEVTNSITANKESVGNSQEAGNKDSVKKSTAADIAVSKENQVVFSEEKAAEELKNANKLNTEADELIAKADDIKSKAASQSNPSVKKSMLAEADKINKQGEEKKTAAANIVRDNNMLAFSTNQNQLDQLIALSKDRKDKEILMAEMMSDEAKVYFTKAQKSRTDADSTNSVYDREFAMAEANSNEKTALEKQKKALEIYKKYYPDFVAKPLAKTTASNSAIVKADVKSAAKEEVKTTDTNLKDTAKTSTNKAVPVAAATVKKETVKEPAASTVNTAKENKVKETAVTPANNKADIAAAKKNTAAKDTAVKVKENNTATNDLTTATIPANAAKQPAKANQAGVPALAPNELFERKKAAVYSAKKPIPVNEKLPEGLVFKVQIGAFKNPIPQNLFKGITPITGETTTQGFTRYMAGVFVKYNTADFAKNQIRDFGYKDAFVVAFLNGKRIPISQALAMVGGTAAAETATQNVIPAVTEQPKAAANQAPAVKAAQPPAAEQKEIAATTNIAEVGGGLFYTVQVGVYSQPVSSAKLYNVLSLYTETAPNGNLRYNVGVYNNTGRATEAKNILVETGIRDAYVTAYYNGKRISMAEAKQLEAHGNITFSSGPNVNALPKFSISNNGQTIVNAAPPEVKKTELVVENKETPTNNQLPNTKMVAEDGIVFKVQIGVFRDQVPLDIANKFLKISSKGITNYVDEKGLTIYTVGSYKSYEEAVKMRAEIADADLKDAFIVAYKDGKKIGLDEARKK